MTSLSDWTCLFLSSKGEVGVAAGAGVGSGVGVAAGAGVGSGVDVAAGVGVSGITCKLPL